MRICARPNRRNEKPLEVHKVKECHLEGMQREPGRSVELQLEDWKESEGRSGTMEGIFQTSVLQFGKQNW